MRESKERKLGSKGWRVEEAYMDLRLMLADGLKSRRRSRSGTERTDS